MCGNRSGDLSLWLDGSQRAKKATPEEEARAPGAFKNTGRHCAFHPHSDEVVAIEYCFKDPELILQTLQVTNVTFVANDSTKVISSSLDGTLRCTDLHSQRLGFNSLFSGRSMQLLVSRTASPCCISGTGTFVPPWMRQSTPSSRWKRLWEEAMGAVSS